jgi:uncharacterized protein (TIGR02466 family)
MPIEVLRHFSIPIFSFVLPDFAERRDSLRSVLTGLRERGPAVQLTNRNSWHSPLDLHTHDDPDLKWMTARILEVARAALGTYYAGFVQSEPRIVECWSVIGGRGAWHTPHQHYPRPWSGVLYVDAEQCVSRSDPADRSGKLEFLNPTPVSTAFFAPPSVAYDPRDGLILIFPGALPHLVHPNATDHERVIVSFNLDVAGTLAKDHP